MKFNLCLFAAVVATLVTPSVVSAIQTVQSFYVPLGENSLLNVLKQLDGTGGNEAVSPVSTLISMAVSTDNTTIFYDHWEDGYDPNWTTSNKQASTLVWGDGDASNGCAPVVGKTESCTNANDVLSAGDVIVLETDVPVPRPDRNTRFRTKDRIGASKPIAVTRAGYAAGSGSRLAGAVEVVEEAKWGKSFELPIGQGVEHFTNAYNQVYLFVMSGSANNVVTKNGQTVKTLSQGQQTYFSVNQGDTVTSTKPMQAHIITGDVNTLYEMRWYSLAPTDQWTNEYYAPVGDTAGGTRATLYNPTNSPITVTATTMTNTYTITVPAKAEKDSQVIPDGSGAKFTSTSNFFAFSSTFGNPEGSWSDWGYPLIPSDQLTSIALIGLGYGCTDNMCDSVGERSVVWVTPVEAADIHVDYDNDGTVDMSVSASALQGVIFTDDEDEDMTGAIVWATKSGSGSKGNPVKIAAAWGQKRSLAANGSNQIQLQHLDLGTVVVPFDPVRATCKVVLTDDKDGNGMFTPGDVVTQIITVINAGPTAISSGRFIVDSLTGPITISTTDARGGEAVYMINYTIPMGETVTEDCDVDVYTAPTSAPSAMPSMAPTETMSEMPSLGPSTNPSMAPTATKSVMPSSSPTGESEQWHSEAPTALMVPPTKPPTTTSSPDPRRGSSSGDPHFKTWTGDKYDYHGECDLVLVDHPSFENGLGLRVHIRTTRVKYFSFVEKVSLQIGEDILEFDNDVENFLINGEKVEANRKHHKTMFGNFLVRRDKKAISVRLNHEGKAKIDFHTRKNGFPAVIVDGGHTDIFKGSLGLLGDWATGQKLARDGKTEFLGIDGPEDDATAFALEWQVRDDEPMLFKESRLPQFPNVCLPPTTRPAGRLGESLFQKEAEEACAHWKHDMDDCIFDVMATRDALVAAEGHIVHIE